MDGLKTVTFRKPGPTVIQRSAVIFALFIAGGGTANAHGEQMLALPFGQVLALPLVLLITYLLRRRTRLRWIVPIGSIALCIAWYRMPIDPFHLVDLHHVETWPYFVYGFVPPILAACLLALLALGLTPPKDKP